MVSQKMKKIPFEMIKLDENHKTLKYNKLVDIFFIKQMK